MGISFWVFPFPIIDNKHNSWQYCFTITSTGDSISILPPTFPRHHEFHYNEMFNVITFCRPCLREECVWFFSTVSKKLSNIACRSGPDTIFSIKTGITTLVTNSIKILFFQLHPFRAEFWGYCALICSALRLMRAGWLTLVPPCCPPPGNNTGRGKCDKKSYVI